MSNENESETARYERKHPWYKRPEILLPAFGPLLCAMIYGLWLVLSTHISDMWNIGENNKRIERRVYRIEMALKISDPVPFTLQITNNMVVVDRLTTNFIDP